jgi:hypothetical protein
MALKDYGTLLKKGTTTVGEIVSVGIPEIKAEKAETTNHSGGGWRTFIPAGLKSLEEFELTILATGSLVSSLYTDMTAETISVYTVDYAATTSGSLLDWSFNAFPTSLKVTDMQSDKPEAITLKVKFQASGSLTISAT